MYKNYTDFYYERNDKCLICGKASQRILGVRGNREYSGADNNLNPHVFTYVVQCAFCGFIYCNPRIIGLEHLEREHYNDPQIYQSYLKNNVMSIFKIGENLIKKYKPYGNLLDVGAGKGDFLLLAKKNGYEVKGIEPSEKFCEFGFKTYGVSIENGYLEFNNYFKDEKFDVITLFHVLEHVTNPQKLLLSISKYLKEDGILYLEVPNADAIILRIADFYFYLIRKYWSSRLSPLHAPFHSYGYTVKSLRYLLEDNGYELLHIQTYAGSVRGYDNHGRIVNIVTFLKSVILKLTDFLPNRELLSVVAKKVV